MVKTSFLSHQNVFTPQPNTALFTIDLVVKVSKVGATSRKTEKHGLREPGFLAHVGGVVKMVFIRQPALMIPSASVAKNLAILLLSVHNSWVAR